MALAAGAGEAREFNGTRVPGVALRASPDRSVVIGLANGVTLLAARCRCGMSFGEHQRIRRPLGAAWLKLLAEGDLLRTQALFTVHSRPAWSGMAATKEFLINGFMAGAAVSRCQMCADDEAVVINLLLAGAWLMAIKAIHTFPGMSRHLVFVNDRILKTGVAFGALSRCADEIGGRLGGFHLRTLPIDQKSSHNKPKCDDDSEEHRTKRHARRPLSVWVRKRVVIANSSRLSRPFQMSANILRKLIR